MQTGKRANERIRGLDWRQGSEQQGVRGEVARTAGRVLSFQALRGADMRLRDAFTREATVRLDASGMWLIYCRHTRRSSEADVDWVTELVTLVIEAQ